MKIVTLLAAVAMTAIAASARATVVTFDDLTSDQVVANGYGGINWNGNWTAYSEDQPPYTAESSPYRVYDQSSGGDSFNFSTPVVFNGAYFAGNAFATVQFQLLLGGSVVATSSILDPSATPTFLASGYSGLVDEVDVLSPSPDFFVMDDVTYSGGVPEPAAWALMLIGVAGLGAALRGRRLSAA